MRPDERGAALLEAIMALAIVTSAGAALAVLVDAAGHALQSALEAERTLERAGRRLAGVAVLDRRELHRRIGSHGDGEFVVSVSRPDPALFRIAVASVEAPARELLVTVVHRPEPAR